MPRRPPRSPYQRLALGFLSVVVLLAVGVLLLSISRVEVHITPRREPITADFDVTIIGSGTPSEREVLGRLVRVEGIGTAERAIAMSAGGAPSVPTATVAPSSAPFGATEGKPARAEGFVTIVNTHTNPQPLVATTRLLSSNGVLFRLRSGVTVPAKGKLEQVVVYADQSGVHGNIGPTKFTIPGLSTWLQARVWAESSTAMTGGQGPAVASAVRPAPARPAALSKPKAVVREEDLAAIREQATNTAKARAKEDAALLTKGGEEVVPIDEVVRVSTTGAVGETRDRVSAEVRVTMTAILIPKGALGDRAAKALEDVSAASGRTLLRVRADKLRTRLVSQDSALARATIAVHAEGDAVLQRGSFAFEPRRIAGFTAGEVGTYLRSIPGVQDVEVQLRPFWVKRVPSSIGSVRVDVREAE